MNKVLIITNHRKNRSPGQRFRFEQYLNFLESNGYQITFSYLLNKKDDKYFYKEGSVFNKVIILIKSFLKRYKEVKTYDNYNIIFVYREAFFTGSTFFEKRIAKSKAKFIFDFDDAIWLHDVSGGNKKWGWLKNPDKIKKIIQYSDMVFAGNDYLATYAKKYNSKVKLIPTTIDTNYHKQNIGKKEKKVCIGWTGSSTTLKYFEDFIPTLLKVKNKHNDLVTFKVIVDEKKEYPELGIKTTFWSLDNEIENLSKIDIGIMPLPEDKWAKGKCGFKGLQYMALKIPSVMSPVGVNTKIIDNNINGFLAKTEKDWIDILSKLIGDEKLRESIGEKGRATVIEKYSVESQKNIYLEAFNNLIK